MSSERPRQTSSAKEDPLFKAAAHREYLKNMLVQKMEKKFSNVHSALIESETINFIMKENVTKEGIRSLEKRIELKIYDRSKTEPLIHTAEKANVVVKRNLDDNVRHSIRNTQLKHNYQLPQINYPSQSTSPKIKDDQVRNQKGNIYASQEFQRSQKLSKTPANLASCISSPYNSSIVDLGTPQKEKRHTQETPDANWHQMLKINHEIDLKLQRKEFQDQKMKNSLQKHYLDQQLMQKQRSILQDQSEQELYVKKFRQNLIEQEEFKNIQQQQESAKKQKIAAMMTNEMINAVESKEIRKSIEKLEEIQLKQREIEIFNRIKQTEEEIKQKKLKQQNLDIQLEIKIKQQRAAKEQAQEQALDNQREKIRIKQAESNLKAFHDEHESRLRKNQIHHAITDKVAPKENPDEKKAALAFISQIKEHQFPSPLTKEEIKFEKEQKQKIQRSLLDQQSDEINKQIMKKSQALQHQSIQVKKETEDFLRYQSNQEQRQRELKIRYRNDLVIQAQEKREREIMHEKMNQQELQYHADMVERKRREVGTNDFSEQGQVKMHQEKRHHNRMYKDTEGLLYLH